MICTRGYVAHAPCGACGLAIITRLVVAGCHLPRPDGVAMPQAVRASAEVSRKPGMVQQIWLRK